MVAEGGSRGEHNFMTFQDFLSAPPQTGGSKGPWRGEQGGLKAYLGGSILSPPQAENFGYFAHY